MRFSNQFRHGALGVAATALVLVAVLLLNLGATALFGGNLLFWDLTDESMYRLNAETLDLMKQTVAEANAVRAESGEEEAKVTILFCADEDLLSGNEKMRYIYYTARALAKEFPDLIDLQFTDVWSNPSSVNAYRVNSYSSIYQTDVIVASGSEFRVLSQKSFYTYSSTTDAEPWAYSGEKNFVKAIRAITKVEMPLCCVTVNHGEPITNGEYEALLATVRGAGYRIEELDLSTQEIPEECRMLLVFDPQTDFTSGNYLSGTPSELGKLDAFLRGANSLILFADPDTPVLTNLETFLEDWGIRFARYHDPDDEISVLGSYRVVSPMDSVNGERGTAVIAEYETAGSGAALTKAMRTQGASPKVVFPNAMPLELSPTYKKEISLATENTGRYEYGKYAKNEEYRAIYKIFTSTGRDRMTYAQAINGGQTLTDAAGDPIVDPSGSFPLATLTIRYQAVSEGRLGLSVDQNSMVCVFGSTDFAGDELLTSNAYGNTDLLLETMRAMGRENFPVGFAPERLHEMNMGDEYYTDGENRTRAIVLALIPAVVAAGLGVWTLVKRRKTR